MTKLTPATRYTHRFDTRGAGPGGTLMAHLTPWELELESGLTSPFATDGRRLYVGVAHEAIAYIDANDLHVFYAKAGAAVVNAPVALPEKLNALLVATEAGVVRRFRASNGAPEMSTQLREWALDEMSGVRPWYIKGDVYAHVGDGKIVTFPFNNDRHLMRIPMDVTGALIGLEAVHGMAGDDLMVLAASSGELCAVTLKRFNAAVAWRRMLEPCRVPLLSVGDVVVAVTRGGVVHGLRGETGESLWRRELDVETPPVAADKIVYLLTRSGHVVALDAHTGRSVWERPKAYNGALEYRLLAARDLLIVTAWGDADREMGARPRDASLEALDRVTGQVVWTHDAGEPLRGVQVGVVGDVVVVGSEEKRLYGLQLEDGEPAWVALVNTTVPVASPRQVLNPTFWDQLKNGPMLLAILLITILGAMLLKGLFTDVMSQPIEHALNSGVLVASVWVLIVVCVGWLFFLVRAAFKEHQLLSDGIALVADVVEQPLDVRVTNTQYVYYRYTDHRGRERRGRDTFEGVAPPDLPAPGTRVAILIDPDDPGRSTLPAIHDYVFDLDEAEAQGRSSRLGFAEGWQPAAFEGSMVWPLTARTEDERGWISSILDRSEAANKAEVEAGRLKADDESLTLCDSGGAVIAEVRWDKPMRVHVSVWPVSFAEAEVNVTIRTVGSPSKAASLCFKSVVPQARLNPALPLKEERFELLDFEAFGVLWPRLLFQAQAYGVELPELEVRSRSKVVGGGVALFEEEKARQELVARAEGA